MNRQIAQGLLTSPNNIHRLLRFTTFHDLLYLRLYTLLIPHLVSLPLSMAGLGSVFLGDHDQRIRPLSTSTQRSGSTATPPSSPPPTGMMYTGRSTTSPLARILDDNDGLLRKDPSEARALPKHIDPRLALELRLRWLEAIVYGTKNQDLGSSTSQSFGRPQAPAKGKQRETLKDGETLVRLAEHIQTRLNETVESNDGVKKFMNHCEYL